MEKNVIVLVLVVILVGLAGFQAVQIDEVKESINEGGEITGKVIQKTNTQSSSRQSAPTMVGGC